MGGLWDLKDEEWAAVEPVLRPARRENDRGRPWHETRAVLNGVFWVLGSGAHWRELPERYPPYQTCHRRFQQWIRSGKLAEALKRLAAHLHERERLDLDEAARGCHLRGRKKRGPAVGPTRRGKGTKIVAVAAGNGLPLAVSVENASPAECRLVEGCSAAASSTSFRPGLSGTRPTIRTRSTPNSRPNTASS